MKNDGGQTPDTAIADPIAGIAPQDLVATFARMRAGAAVHWSRHFGGWIVTRHAEAASVLRDANYVADDPIARFDRIEQRGGPAFPNLAAVLRQVSFYVRSPRHDAMRRFASRIFQSFDLPSLRGCLERRAAHLLRCGRVAGTIDLALGYGSDLSLFTLHQVLGLPFEECLQVAALGRRVAWIFDSSPRSLRELRQAEACVGSLLDHFEQTIPRERSPTDDSGFAVMIRGAEAELGLCHRELAAFSTFFFVGGLETTATGIAFSAMHLLQHPALREQIGAGRTKLAGAARELLRLASPFQYVTRLADRDAVLGEQFIRAGDRVTILLGSANRDPAAFCNPDEIIPDRRGAVSLAFGHGAYRCLGAGVAQVATEAALTALLTAPDLELRPGGIEWENRTRVPSLSKVPAAFTAAAAGARGGL